jgi:hypothetical protein
LRDRRFRLRLAVTPRHCDVFPGRWQNIPNRRSKLQNPSLPSAGFTFCMALPAHIFFYRRIAGVEP